MRRVDVTPAVNVVTGELRQAILTGSLRPGQKLRQEDLAAQLGVSRMPVRQALAVLEREGLVETDRSRVATVKPLSADYIRDVYKFREVLERYVAETLASRRLALPNAREILTSAKAVIANRDTSQAIELDIAFHTHLYDAVGNHVLSEVMRHQWTHIRRVMFMGLFVGLSGFRDSVWDEHAAILDAIENGDVERAGNVAASHMVSASVVALQNVDLLALDSAVADVGTDDLLVTKPTT